METVTIAWNALKVALGLGFVIFIHELGHFLLAKWNGVKVEKFSIGFGPTLASFRRGVGLRIGTNSRPPGPGDPPSSGETEYILAALPLGGYVKMLGEATEDHNPNDVERSTDPRAFHNKPVGGRMAIITAGVIMNLILGFLCFTFVHTQPGTDIEPRVGGVQPGSPAEAAGLRPGDEVVAVDGERDVSLRQVVNRIRLSGRGDKVHLLIRRPGVEGERAIDIEPRITADSPMPAIGIVYPAVGLGLNPKRPVTAPPGQQAAKDQPTFPESAGDVRVVGVGPEGGPIAPVSGHADLVAQLDKLRAVPAVVEVEAAGTPGAGGKPDAAERSKITLQPHRFLDFGFELTPGPIASIRPDSPASRAGLKVGDRIVAVAGQANYDPLKLPDLARDHAGSPLELTVRRAGATGDATETVSVTPDATPPWAGQVSGGTKAAPLAVPGLGLALAVGGTIQAVAPDSPAAKAGLKAGDKLRSVVVTPQDAEGAAGKAITFAAADDASAWPAAYESLQEVPVQSVRFLVEGAKEPVEVKPVEVADRFHPLRGLNLLPAVREVPPASLGRAIQLGAAETLDNVTSIFKIFRSLAQKRVGGDAFGGLIPIGQVAYNAASAGFVPLVGFLGFLSVQLAVLNFLPIPPLDGGQFVFLAAEKARGKPLPDAALNVGTIAGIAFVLILIVAINVKDVVQLVQSYF